MRLLTTALVLCLLATAARAQSAITIVVNFAAGGSADRMARLIAPEMADALGSGLIA